MLTKYQKGQIKNKGYRANRALFYNVMCSEGWWEITSILISYQMVSPEDTLPLETPLQAQLYINIIHFIS